jgi:hypothetical protein
MSLSEGSMVINLNLLFFMIFIYIYLISAQWSLEEVIDQLSWSFIYTLAFVVAVVSTYSSPLSLYILYPRGEYFDDMYIYI